MNPNVDLDSNAEGPDHDAGSAAPAWGGARAALIAVNVLLFAEAAAMVAIVVWLIVDLVALEPSSWSTAIALTVLATIGALWIVAVAFASLRRAPLTRSAAIVWQVLQIAVAVGAFQGLFARPDVGWALLVPAIAVIGLLVWTPVRLAYTRSDAEVGTGDEGPRAG
ncbi:hypothetical protein ET445_15555 [Agromyces protaetiae]|uniref:Uncharacterized protein n=1 Tax=Agromyces protaetiae TaxID=2509455 RepID=A0A4P6FH87_9MICO|nr:hypothetical protein [Agromyces protaetiae]QAY74533.1 hypothetical protein ET445_15555 [Agromyces protaetiae]